MKYLIFILLLFCIGCAGTQTYKVAPRNFDNFSQNKMILKVEPSNDKTHYLVTVRGK